MTKHIAEKMAQEHGVRLLYHSWVCGAIMEERCLKGIWVLGKEGMTQILCHSAIDATGDADLAVFCGVACEKDDAPQPMSVTFMLGGVESDGDSGILSEESAEKLRRLRAQGRYPVPNDNFGMFQTSRKGELYCNLTRCPGDATKTQDLTNAEITCRRQIFDCVEFLRRELPEFAHCYLMHSAPSVGVRETRRIRGRYTLTEEDVVSGRHFSDEVSLNSYYVDVHLPNEQTTRYPIKAGRTNGIPYRCMLPEEVEGLLVCGRCISTTHMGLGAVRVMGTAMGMGEAAGIAAALSVKMDCLPSEVPVSEIRQRQIELGVPLQNF